MILLRLGRPWLLISIAVFHFFLTFLKLLTSVEPFNLLTSTRLRPLFSWRAFREVWLTNFWSHIAPSVKNNAEPRVHPLLEGRVDKGRICEKVVGKPVEGIIIEMGTGCWMWADVFAKLVQQSRTSGSNGPSKIYSMVPDSRWASVLCGRVKQLGLEGIYEILPMHLEWLTPPTARSEYFEPGSVDCIVTVQCLCSIPEPEKTMRLLYKYLKKGGRWYVYEHVEAKHGTLVPAFQRFTDFFWKYITGGCRLCRPTGKTLEEIGSWEKVDLAPPPDEARYEVVPYIMGTLTK